MATSLRDLRRKMKSIRGTQKITSAMQLVAASKMARATKRATESRPYTDLTKELIDFIAPVVESGSQPLFEMREVKTILFFLVTTNRGLAGPLNTQLIRKWLAWQAEQRSRDVKVVAVGAKGRNYLLRFHRDQLLADFPAPDTVPDFRDTTPIAQLALDEFLRERVDAVYIAYNQFVSTLRQEPRIIPFLPFRSTSEVEEPRQSAGRDLLRGEIQAPADILFEPSQAEILRALLPRYLRVRLYQTLLESFASEQSARMVAMKSATDNAGDLIDDLSLTANSLRQASITGELLDIAAGASALGG